MVDWVKVRDDFPVLKRKIETLDGQEKPIVYFDNACMALKPIQVVHAMNEYYFEFSGCAGRSIHTIGEETTDACHEAREKIAKFINAKHVNKETKCHDEIIWTRNTTEGINLVARALRFPDGCKVISTSLEHHSGILPFYELSKRQNVKLQIVKARPDGTFDLKDWEKAIDNNTRLISIVRASNVSATVIPVEEICEIAHDHGALVLTDDAQYAPHHKMDMQKPDVDFSAFSVHKMCGPTGMGILYVKHGLYEEMDTSLVGGDTIKRVRIEEGRVGCEYLPPPEKYEAGLQNYAGAIGAGAAAGYLMKIGMENIEQLEKRFTRKLMKGLLNIPEVKLIGPQDYHKRSALTSFTIEGMKTIRDAHEVARTLDRMENIMVRSGHHCAMPYHRSIGIQGSVRASLYFYNTEDEIDLFLETLQHCVKNKAFTFMR